VPIEADFGIDLIAHAGDEGDERAHAIRCSEADRVGQAQSPGPRTHRLGVDLPEVFRLGARCILGDEHHGQASLDGEGDRVVGQPEQGVQVPTLGVLAHRARAEEDAGLDRDPGLAGGVDDRGDVGLERPGGALRLDRHVLAHDLAREHDDVLLEPLAGAA
jgi:hypothetical protein